MRRCSSALRGAARGRREAARGELGAPLIATGDILREAIAEGSALGKSAAQDVKAGRLVARRDGARADRDEVGTPGRERGFILDGFRAPWPRRKA